ncbi:protein ROS1-like protein isoform X1 [Cinnamomum micranthum f. kanehirae]|uniref:Protein ROS1-like protein isoform X1 n=1 Tax=Cinnamomum micranthum f. kanehirae TaxID=337451 RepID=A0A443NE23_9MAGN|nr:protein ROS1-like protein isoform X1 [Cinnamomum micranthum f. kanehirae]
MMEVRIQMKSATKGMRHRCEPIIEEPATPEPECLDTLERAIEDAFWTENPDEIPMIKLNIKEFMQNVDMQEKGELQDVDMSRALVALTQEAATIPMPKLKNVSRLQTEHQVYELPDAHPLLAKLDRRMLDDPCTYLLTVWTPGETAQSIQPPEIDCTSQKSGNLCSKKTCFTCNSMREANAQAVKGTLLIYIWEILTYAPLKKRPIFCFSHASTPPAGGGSRGRGPKKRHNPNRSRKKTEGLPVGSKNKPMPPIYMTRESDYTTQTTMIEIPPDGDIVNGVADFAFRRRIGICILSCNGAVANVSFIDSTSSHAHASTVTLNGRFETLSLYATFLTYPIPPPPSQSSSPGYPTKLPITISFAGAIEQVIGGKVVEALIVAGLVVVASASFRYISLLRLQPMSEKANDTNPNVGIANACCGDAGLWRPSSEHHQSPASFIENALVVQYYFYDARSGHQFQPNREVDSFARCGDADLQCPSSELHQSPASSFENALVVQYYFYDARSGHQFRLKKEVDSFARCGDASLRHPSSEHHQSPASFIENALVVQYYFYDARSGHQFRSKKEVDSCAQKEEVPRYKTKSYK